MDDGVRDDHGEATRDAGERGHRDRKHGASMSRARVTAMAIARRKCKIRTRKRKRSRPIKADATWVREASQIHHGRATELTTSQDAQEPMQRAFLDQDEMDDAEVDDLNENDEFGMYLIQLFSTLEDTEWDKRPELQAEYVGPIQKNERQQRLTSATTTASS